MIKIFTILYLNSFINNATFIKYISQNNSYPNVLEESLNFYAPVAQLDRVSGYGPEGWGFESSRAYLTRNLSLSRGFLLFGVVISCEEFAREEGS